MKLTEELLKEFWRDANSYQSIDVGCFDIDEYAEEWIERHRSKVNNVVLDDVIKCDCKLEKYERAKMELDYNKCMDCKKPIE